MRERDREAGAFGLGVDWISKLSLAFGTAGGSLFSSRLLAAKLRMRLFGAQNLEDNWNIDRFST